MNIEFHLTIIGVLAAALIGVFFYRKWLEDHCDHYIHLHGTSTDAKIVGLQECEERRVQMLDRVNKYLIAAIAVYSVGLVAVSAYKAITAG